MLFVGFLVAWFVLTFERYRVRDTYNGDPLHTLLCRFTKDPRGSHSTSQIGLRGPHCGS